MIVPGVEPGSSSYKEPALTIELHYRVRLCLYCCPFTVVSWLVTIAHPTLLNLVDTTTLGKGGYDELQPLLTMTVVS